MSKRTLKTIFTLILSIVMVIAIFLSYITYDKRFFEEDYEFKTGGAFSSTRELIIKPIEKEEQMKFISDKDGNILWKAPYDRGAELGLEAKDGPLELQDSEFSPDENFKNYKRVTKKAAVNEKEILTKENFEESQKIIIDRLRKTGVEDFEIKTNSETGNIVLRFSDVNEAESEKLDKVKRIVETRGEFAVIDAKTGKTFLDNTHIKKLTPYEHQEAGVVLEIEFTKEGKDILSDITSKYIKREKDLTDKERAKLEKEAEEEDKELDTTETAALYMTLDGNPISMGAFEEPINSGTLTIPLSKETNKLTEKDLKEAKDEADELAAIIRAGRETVRYEIFKETRLVSPMDRVNILILVGIIGIIILAMLVVAIVLFRLKGVFAWFLSLVYLIVLYTISKYTSIAITIPSVVAIMILYLIQFVFSLYMLKDVERTGEARVNKNLFLITRNTIIIIIAAIILTFAKETNLSSFGQMICLGEILLIIHNLIFAKNVLN